MVVFYSYVSLPEGRDFNEENITFFRNFFLGIWHSTFFLCIEGIGTGESAINDGVKIP